MIAIFDSHTSSCSTYLSFLRVSEDFAVKGQSSCGPGVHSQSGEGERLLCPLVFQKAVVHLLLVFLSRTLLVFILGVLSKLLLVINFLQGYEMGVVETPHSLSQLENDTIIKEKPSLF